MGKHRIYIFLDFKQSTQSFVYVPFLLTYYLCFKKNIIKRGRPREENFFKPIFFKRCSRCVVCYLCMHTSLKLKCSLQHLIKPTRKIDFTHSNYFNSILNLQLKNLITNSPPSFYVSMLVSTIITPKWKWFLFKIHL